MKVSLDPLHDDAHIGRLLKNLSLFLKAYPNHHLINFETLLLAICWHDAWKAQRVTLNPLKLIYYQLYEGIGSMILFSKGSVGILSSDQIADVNYAIRKHAQFQLVPLSTFEAKILKDIDDLDVLNVQRMRYVLQKIHTVGHFTKLFGKMWFWYATRKNASAMAEFTWTQRRLDKTNQIIRKLLLLI
jgi:hypothetical protein